MRGVDEGEAELDFLLSILSNFNDLFGNIDWKDADKRLSNGTMRILNIYYYFDKYLQRSGEHDTGSRLLPFLQ